MDRRVAIVVGVVVAVGAAVLVLRSAWQDEEQGAYRVAPVSEMSRIEIDGTERIVLERREDTWWVAQPVEGPADPRVGGTYLTIFTREIAVDDGDLEEDRAEGYGLGEGRVILSLYGREAEDPVVSLEVGRESVTQRGARRTYVRPVGGERIYRAQAGFGDLVRKPVADLLDRQVFAAGAGGLQEIRLAHGDGHEVALVRVGNEWTFAGNELDVDEPRVRRLVRGLGNLQARGFVDGEPSQWGFEEPTVVISGAPGMPELKVVRWQAEERQRVLVKRTGESLIFELSDEDGEALTYRESDLRDRSILGVSSRALSEVRYPGRYHLQRGPDGWVSSDRGVAVDQERASELARAVAGLRAEAWVEEGAVGGGNFEQIGPIHIGVDGHGTILEIGELVEGASGSRYARYSAREGVFIIDRRTIERLTLTLDALTLQAP